MTDIYDDLSVWPGGPEFVSIHQGGFNGPCVARVTKGGSLSDTEFTKVSRTLRAAFKALEDQS